jgi:hypothetical protein
MLGDCAEQGAPNAAPRTVLPTARAQLNRYLPLCEKGAPGRELPDRRNVPAELVESLLRDVYDDVRGDAPAELDGCCDAMVHELGESGMARVGRLAAGLAEKTRLALSDHAVVLAAILAAQRTLLKKEPARPIIIGGLRPPPGGEWRMEA